MPAPQYAKSTDPGVVAIVTANRESEQRTRDLCMEFATRFGAKGWFPDWPGPGMAALALTEKPTGHGQWVWYGRDKRGVLPGVRNPLRAEMESLGGPKPMRVPGLPDLYTAARGWQTLVMTPKPFVWDGATWLGFSEPPTGGEVGAQWQEIKASEWHAAKEACEESLRTDS